MTEPTAPSPRNTFDAAKGTSNGAEQFFSVAKRNGMR
eukprot:COSAG01_NODE_23991_length_794_cov_3.661871_1_plen_36_part_10